MRQLLLLFVLFCCFEAFSQNKGLMHITIEVKNEMNQKVNNAYLIDSKKNILLGTSNNGESKFSLIKLPVTISISHISYKTQYVVVERGTSDRDSLNLTVILEDKVVKLDEVEISSEKTNLAYIRKQDNVKDYELYENNIMLLLKAGKYSKLRLINNRSNSIYDLTIRQKADNLFRDCFNNLHVAYKDSVFQILFTDKEFYLSKGYSVDEFSSTLSLCKSSLNSSFVLGYSTIEKQEVHYFLKTPDRKSYTFLRSSADLLTKAKARFYAEKYENNSENFISSVSTNDLDELSSVRALDRAYTYFKYVESNPLYSPIFRIKDSYYIFDHIVDSIFQYNDKGEQLNSKYISYQKEKDWEQSLVVDYINDDIYAVFERSNKTYLIRVDINNGKLEEKKVELPHIFPEKILIRGGVAYYLKKELYQSGLPQQLFKFRLD